MTNEERAIGAALEAANEVNRIIGVTPALERDRLRKLYLILANAPIEAGLATIEENEIGTHDIVSV